MSRPHINDAPPIPKRTFEQYLGQGGDPAEAWLAAASAAYTMGYATDPPQTPTVNEVSAALTNGAREAAARIRTTRAAAYAHEQAALQFWDSLRAWRMTEPGPGRPGYVEASQ